MMDKKAHFYIKYNNIVVLKYYLDTIKIALEKMGFMCDYVEDVSGLNKKDLFIFPMGIDAYKFYHKGFKNYILWQQGATADESFMRNHSKLRYTILNYIDCFAMKKAKCIFFCSEYMRKHYEELAHVELRNKSYLMPCYNEQLSPEIIKSKNYQKKSFAYVGSLDLWQCFDETLKFYKKIEERFPDAELKVLTFSVEEAEIKIRNAGIQNYKVKCVKKEEVKKELSDVVYGFILRKDSIVNRVATPTKLSSYMSVGVIPIFSVVLDDFNRVSAKMKYTIPVNERVNWETFFEKINDGIDREQLLDEYLELFKSYYGTEKHINNIFTLFRGLL